MTIAKNVNNIDLKFAIERYAEALNALEEATENPSSQQVLEILLVRDAVDELLYEKTKVPANVLAKLIELDNRLHKQANAIASCSKLEEWRKSLKPTELAWWWFFKPDEKIDSWDRYDWVWNSLTVACLTAFVAYMTSLVPRFAVGGLGLLESFGVIGPSGLMALALSSIKGGAGKEVIQASLKKLGIHPHFHSEATFGVSAILLMGAIATNANLPKIANLYYQTGLQYYNQGLLRKAQDQYLQAINLKTNNIQYHIALGEVYESLADLKSAEQQYKEAVTDGTPDGFNHLGRVYLQQKELATAEALFQIGLQRADDLHTKFQLHRNLGWVFYEEKKYDQAVVELQAAIEVEKQIKGRPMGAGMANCLLAKTFEMQGKAEIADREWSNCQKFGRPETLFEFKWIANSAPPELAAKIDTTGVVNYDKSNLAPNSDTPAPPSK